MAGVLHDVVEDTPVSLGQLRDRGYPGEVLAIVESLTRRKEQGESYDDFISRIQQNPAAIPVKLADLRDNLNLMRIKEPAPDDHERVEKYRRALRRLGAEE